jgi:hypothetical protein
MGCICKFNNVHLVRQLLERHIWTLDDAEVCLRVAARHYCRDIIELLLDFGVDVTNIHCSWQPMYDAVKRYNTPVVKLILKYGASARPLVLSHCEMMLNDRGYVCLRDFNGTDDEIFVSYMVAKHRRVSDIGRYTVLERLVGDVDDSKVWTAGRDRDAGTLGYPRFEDVRS